ncbi:MAG: MipA/OmpV family protein [Gammaproteobacteria bacterium]|nr:MipA/OmpV family protein [Gammaproteobacteria bacterium]
MHKIIIRCGLLLVALSSLAAHGAELPLWEAGLGVAGLSIPDYRGSDERSQFLLPLPYVVYRGENWKVDREGLRGDLFRSNRLRLDLSFSAGPPSKSDDDDGARAGMPELDPTFEAGPALRIQLDDREQDDQRWSLVLPVRWVAASDFRHAESLGWVFSPYLRYARRDLIPGWTLDSSIGFMYAGERYHNYYYDVTDEFATPARPAYDAGRGYSGSRVTAAISKRFDRFWVGGFVRYDYLGGAVFDDSPLVRTDHSLMIGGGIAWIFARSAETVPSLQ